MIFLWQISVNKCDETLSLKEAYDGKVVEGKEVLIREKRKTKRVWLCTNDYQLVCVHGRDQIEAITLRLQSDFKIYQSNSYSNCICYQ